MATLYILIGPHACGKSTFAEKMQRLELGVVVSSDQVRKQLYGDEPLRKDVDAKVKMIDDTCHRRIKDMIAAGCDVIFDALNIDPEDRKAAIDVANAAGADQIVGIMFDIPLEQCLLNDRKRGCPTPEEVIAYTHCDMYDDEPKLSEGFEQLLAVRYTAAEIKCAGILATEL